MSVLFLQYPPCSTCKNAKKWLDAHQVSYESRNIKEENPTAPELADWIKKSGLPLKKFFNTSGILYKEKHLKDLLPGMSEKEQIDLLSTDGMLVKRPLIIGEDFVLVGFKEEEWDKAFTL
jgi:arsenate reductase